MEKVEYVDLSKAINAVIFKNGSEANNGEEYKESAKEANKIWQFQLNDRGNVILDETICFGEKFTNSAEIIIAKGGNGLWAMSVSYVLPTQGSGQPLTVFERIGFKSKDDAVLAAILTLQNRLKNVLDREDSSVNDYKAAQHLYDLVELRKKPQLSLF